MDRQDANTEQEGTVIGRNRERKLDAADGKTKGDRERSSIFLNASPVNHLSHQKHFQVLLCVLSVCLGYHVCHSL